MHHEIDLRDDLDIIWRETPATFKRAYKRAVKCGVTFSRCSLAELPQFYRLHLKLRKNKYRIFPQPYRYFENIRESSMGKGKRVVIGAYDRKGEMIAGQVFLACGKSLYYKFSASSPEALYQKPNNLLMWEGIKYAKESGLQRLDLGSSGYAQQGLIWF